MNKSPDLDIVSYNDGTWVVRRRLVGELAETRDPRAAVAALRLLGGPEAVSASAAYLREIGCRPGHVVLDALTTPDPTP